MTEKKILADIGMTDAELRAYFKKLHELYQRLTPKERKVFRTGRRALLKSAVKSFHRKIKAEELEDFIRLREPEGEPIMLIVRKVCKPDKKNDEIQ